MSDETNIKPNEIENANIVRSALAEVVSILKDLPSVESDDKLRLAKLHVLLTGDKTNAHIP